MSTRAFDQPDTKPASGHPVSGAILSPWAAGASEKQSVADTESQLVQAVKDRFIDTQDGWDGEAGQAPTVEAAQMALRIAREVIVVGAESATAVVTPAGGILIEWWFEDSELIDLIEVLPDGSFEYEGD